MLTPDLADPERRLALAYAPAARRPALATLWALDERLASFVAAAREPVIGQMRLVWWRDALAALDGRAPPAEPLLQAIAATVLPAGLTGGELADMVEGWDALLPVDAIDDAALALHAEARGERLFALAGRLLGGTPPVGAGALWARSDAARRFGLASPPAVPLPPGWPRALRPLGMLAALAAEDPAGAQGSPRRLFRMLRHRLTGR